jgi:hypothetical protein
MRATHKRGERSPLSSAMLVLALRNKISDCGEQNRYSTAAANSGCGRSECLSIARRSRDNEGDEWGEGAGSRAAKMVAGELSGPAEAARMASEEHR